LASTYRSQGRWEEAEQLEVHVVETRKRVLGTEHPHTLKSVANLAVTYHSQGRLREAKELGVQVVHVSKRFWGQGIQTHSSDGQLVTCVSRHWEVKRSRGTESPGPTGKADMG
jgi:hypothetical protein